MNTLHLHRARLGQLLAALCTASGLLTMAASARAVTSAELYQTQAEVYGRFEARIRFAPGDGVISSFFLWKSGSEVTGAYWNELDFEKLGADCHMQTNAIFGAPDVQHSQVNAFAGDLCGAYHTYGFEWAPTYISWQIDGTEVRRDTSATATAFAQNATSGMQIHFNVWPGDASFGGTFSPAILPVSQYVSWVQYFSYANNSFSLAWREDFDAATLPSGWATGNWASPKGYSTDSPSNVNFVNGVSVLSLTSDTATGFTGTPPADSGGAGSGSSGAGGAPGGDGASGATGGASAGASGASGGASGGAIGTSVGGSVGTSGASTAGSATSATSAGATASPSAGSAGTSSAAAGSSSTAGSAGSTSSESTQGGSTSGCSCRLAPTPRRTGSVGLLSLVALAALRQRRRKLKRLG